MYAIDMEEIKSSLQKEMGLHIEESTASTTPPTAVTSSAVVSDTEPAQPTSSSSAAAAAVMATVEVKVDPEYYRRIEETVATLALGTGRVEVLHMRILNTNPVSAPTAGHKDDHAGSESADATSASKHDKKSGKKTTKKSTSASTTTTATAGVDALYPVPEHHDEDDNSESDGDAEGDDDHPTSSSAIITSMRELSLDHTKRSFKEQLLVEGDSDSDNEQAAGIVRKNKQVTFSS